MTAAKAKLAEVPVIEGSVVDNGMPVLKVGDHEFTCKSDRLPFGTLLKYAESDIELPAVRAIIVKLIHEDDLDALWDAFDEVGMEAASEAIQSLLGDIAERPTKRP